MKKSSRPGILLLMVITAAFALGLCTTASAGDVAQVNLILDEGVVLIYKGADYGFHNGDRLDVLRDGQTIGSLEVTYVYPTFTKAKIISQDKSIQVFDVVSLAAPGMPQKTETKKEEKKPEKKKEEKKAETKKEEKKKSEPKKEEKKAETKTEEKKKPEPKKEEKAPVADKSSFEPYTSVSLGYFYFNQDFEDISIQQPPVISYGLDYWGPAKKGHRMMYSGAYARPRLRVTTTGSPITYKARMWYLSANYIVDRPGKEKSSAGNFYYGAGLAYRRASFDRDFADGMGIDSSSRGIDWHGIIGYRFNSDLGFKGMYSFDEDYYSLTIGYAMN